MKPPNLEDEGGPTAAAVIEMLRAVTHKMTPAERLAVVRIAREGLNLVPPDTDPRLRARITVARGIPAQVAETLSSAMEPFIVWQQAANTTPEEMRRLRSPEEHRALFEELKTFWKFLGFNIDLAHYQVIAKSRDAYRSGRNLSGPEGLAIQPALDAVAPAIARATRRKRPAQVEDKKK
jgi:hypothetical protein